MKFLVSLNKNSCVGVSLGVQWECLSLQGPETALDMEALPRDTVDQAPAAHELLIVASEIQYFFPPALSLAVCSRNSSLSLSDKDLNCWPHWSYISMKWHYLTSISKIPGRESLVMFGTISASPCEAFVITFMWICSFHVFMKSLGGWLQCFRWCQSFAKRRVKEAQKATHLSPKVFVSVWGVAQGRIVCIKIESRHLLCTLFSMQCLYIYICSYIFTCWGGLFSDFWPVCGYFSVNVW